MALYSLSPTPQSAETRPVYNGKKPLYPLQPAQPQPQQAPVSYDQPRSQYDPMQEQAFPMDAFRAAADQTAGELGAELQTQADQNVAEKGLLSRIGDAGLSIPIGVARSVFETGDFLFGDTPEDQQWSIRRAIEQKGNELGRESVINGLVEGVSQFGAGLIGAGKLAALAKLPKAAEAVFGATKLTKWGMLAGESAATAVVVMDPHQNRLSNLIEQFPALDNPITAYLAASPDDSGAEGRLKNALEDLGLSVATVGAFAGSLAIFRKLRRGEKVAEADIEKAAAQIATAGQTEEEAAASLAKGNAKAAAESTAQASDSTLNLQDVLLKQGQDKAEAATAEQAIPEEWVPPSNELRAKLQYTTDNPVDHWQGQRVEYAQSAQELERPKVGTTQRDPKTGDVVIVDEDTGKVIPLNQVGLVRGATWGGGPRNKDIPHRVSYPDGTYKTFHPDGRVEVLHPDGTASEHQLNMDDVRQTMEQSHGASMRQSEAGASAFKEDAAPYSGLNEPKRGERITDLPRASRKLQPGIPDLGADAEGLIKTISRDVEALTRFGSRQAAIEAGYKFGGRGGRGKPGSYVAPGRDLLPWQMWNVPDEVQATMKRFADAAEARIREARGTDILSDPLLMQMIVKRVKLFNDDPARILGLIQQQGKNARTAVADMEAGATLGLKMVDEAMTVQREIKMGNLARWNGNRAAALEEFGKRAGLATEFLAQQRAILSGAGRTLRRARSDMPRIDLEALRKMKGLPVEKLMELFDRANGDIGLAAKALNKPGLIAQAWDWINFLRVNNLLWNLRTHVVNLTSNAYMMVARPFERVVGATAGRAINAATFGKVLPAFSATDASAIRVQAMREYRYFGASAIDSFTTALEAFRRGDSVLAPHSSEWQRMSGALNSNVGGRIAWRKPKNLMDVLVNTMAAAERAVGTPTRTLGLADEFSKQISYRSSVMAKASMEADRLGLQGPAYKAFIDKRLAASLDDMGRAVDEEALYEAHVRTFNQDLEAGVGKGIQTFKAQHPWMSLILPFVRTPTNVFRYAWKLTPGLNVLQKEYRAMLSGSMGAEAQAQAIGQMGLGTLYLSMAAFLVHAGVFTGSGPQDGKARSQMAALGWQPNSIVWVNDKGQLKSFPLGRFDPIAMPFGIVADIMDVMNAQGDNAPSIDHAVAAAFWAVVGQMKSRTYLLGLTQFLDALQDPGENGERFAKFAGNTTGTLVPGSSLWRMTTTDPYMREVRGLVDGIMANTPGLMSNLTPRRDMFGDPIRARRVALISSTSDSVVDNELVRMGLDAGVMLQAPQPSTSKGGGDMRDITLEDGRNAFDVYQELAGHPQGKPSLKEQLAEVIQSNAYQRAMDGGADVPGTKLWMLSRIAKAYRAAARAQLMRMSPLFRQKMQEQELRARSALLNTRPPQAAGGAAVLRNLGAKYGFDLSPPGQ